MKRGGAEEAGGGTALLLLRRGTTWKGTVLDRKTVEAPQKGSALQLTRWSYSAARRCHHP
eukprot:SAG22_NODE_18584_length_284_cov_1.686486_1_plen_59_part_01